MARHNIEFNGNNITMDSFNSASATNSIWHSNFWYKGQNYGTWSNSLTFGGAVPSRTANVVVSTADSVLDVSNVKIYGYIEIAPGGTNAFSSDGSVGDFTWVPTTGVQPGHVKDDVTFTFNSLNLPKPTNSYQAAWFPIPRPTNVITIGGKLYTNSNPFSTSGHYTIDGVDYNLIITNRYAIGTATNIFYARDSLTSHDFLFIDATNVVIFLTNGISTVGQITVNTNAGAQFWTAGDIRVQGNGEIDNRTGYALALGLYDVAGSPVRIDLGGHGLGIGYIYAPSSQVIYSGGAGEGDVIGAIFCDSIIIGGSYFFHIDETLATAPVWITAQPTNRIVQAGSNTTFSITATGTGRLSYQLFPTNFFQFHTNVWGAQTNSLFTLFNVQPRDATNYFIVVSNGYSSAVSSLAQLIVFTNAAATLGAASNSPAGNFQFNITGVTGLTYTVQSSTNLIDWVPVRTNTSPFLYTDPNAADFPQQFYRAVYFP